MKHENRISRTRADSRAALREQILLLVTYCHQYDQGLKAFSKPMAGTLRILLHNTKRSTSLLQQLGLRSGRFYTAAPAIPSNAFGTVCKLVMMHAAENGAEFLPITRPLLPKERVPFLEWWSRPILLSAQGIKMSRSEVVMAVADMDGGAHIDPGLDPKYAAFRSGELLGYYYVDTPNGRVLEQLVAHMVRFRVRFIQEPGGPPRAENVLTFGTPEKMPTASDFLQEPQYACVRSIAHEFLLTMERYAPWSFSTPYKPPEPRPYIVASPFAPGLALKHY